MPRFRWDDLEALGTEIFVRVGAPREEAAWVAALLTRASLGGHDSHGVLRIPEYVRECRAGRVRPAAVPAVEECGPATLRVDGRFGFGQVVARRGMELAIARARAHGVAAVALRRLGHVGRLADYVELAAEAGLAGLMVANDGGGNRIVAPAGGLEGRLSTNPLAIGLPRRSPPHLVVDLATSVVAAGTLAACLAAGEPAPAGALQDAEGRPTTDPAAPYRDPPGTLLPMAGHKGYALAVAIEVLAGVLTGAGFARPDAALESQGVLVLALDIGRFVPLDRFVADVEALVAYVKSARRRPGVAEIHVPGEPAWRRAQARRAAGVPVAEATWAEIVAVCRELGVTPPAPLPEG
ncbi:MAG TPA: Ldh family oxidoreductase [Thermodesulfobacteriota bacterium]|nr:Ldh family oxidoreductase [Thermodesulfobacteriota bacterium]